MILSAISIQLPTATAFSPRSAPSSGGDPYLTPSSTAKPNPTPTPTTSPTPDPTLLRIGSDGAIAELEIECFADVMINGCDLLHALTEGNSGPRHNHKLLDEVKFSHGVLSGLRRKNITLSYCARENLERSFNESVCSSDITH